MGSRTRVWFSAAALLMTAAVSVRAGGWSVITVSELPEFVRAGEPFTLTYAVRQHGVSPVSDLNGRLEARADNDATVVAHAVAAEPGFYKATLTLPNAGRWTLGVSTGFVEGMTGRPSTTEIYRDGPPMKLVAVAATAPPPVAQTLSERGLHLYVAKGCVMCHAHARSDVRSLETAPALTNVRRSAGDLRSILTHGLAARDQAEYIRMPNLGLRSNEIDALIAFLQPASASALTRYGETGPSGRP